VRAAGAAGRPVAVEVGDVIAEVDPRFLSVAIDTAQALGGRFWALDGGFEEEIRSPFDFERAQLRALARPLAPAVLRVGGTAADFVAYDLSANPSLPDAGYSLLLTRERWDAMHRFAADVGFDVLFTLNAGPGPRLPDGRWDDREARALVTAARQAGQAVALWELGNEINGFPFLHRPPSQRDVCAAEAVRCLQGCRH